MLFIAEIGQNHNGNIDLGFELIKQAKNSGANIAKFQLGWKSKKNESNHIPKEKVYELKKCADYYEIDLMFSVFNLESLEILKSIDLKYYKVASRTVRDDIELVKEICNQNKITFISLGMWDKETLPIKHSDKINYLWCKSLYPTLPDQMLDFPKNFNNSKYIGYSDHTLGIETCILAISRGAKVIEKHFTTFHT